MGDESTFNTRGLDDFMKLLKTKGPSVVVGILGDKDARRGSGKKSQTSNATVGAVHEFGSPARNIPVRSFLRVPIADNLQKYLEQAGAFDEDTFKKVMKEGSYVPWLKKVGAVGVKVVLDAFDTQGFGKWPSWKNPSYSNRNGAVLDDTGQLKSSISFEVR